MNQRGILLLVLMVFLGWPGSILGFESALRASTSRAKADMRTVAIHLQSYYSDHGTYPQARLNDQVPSTISPGNVDPHKVTFYERSILSPIIYFLCPLVGGLFLWLLWKGVLRLFRKNTKVSRSSSVWEFCFAVLFSYLCCCYVTAGIIEIPDYSSHENLAYPPDSKGFIYHSDLSTFFVLQGVGPDGDRDVDRLDAFDYSVPSNDDGLPPGVVLFLYDPTNGSVSSGDIFRIGRP